MLIVMCEIHQFHLHFLTWSSSPSLIGDLSLVKYGVGPTVYGMFFMCFWVVLSCFVFVQKPKKRKLFKNCKNLKPFFQIAFFQSWFIVAAMQ